MPASLHNSDALVLALPRGGVPVGFAVARELSLALDILVVRKLGLPGQEEYAMGAVGSGGVCIVQPDLLHRGVVSRAELDATCQRELACIAQREKVLRGDRAPPCLHGRTLILVDDGVATGSTMRAAIAVARAGKPERLIVAVPVGAPDSCVALEAEVEQLVCLARPAPFVAVSKWYQHFGQISDDEVQDLLALAWRARRPRQTAMS